MIVSTKGRFALRLMVDLAQHAEEEKCSLKEIAERQDLPLKYLEQIVAMLNKAGLIRSTRGYRGGYHLNKPAADYTAGEILRATEGSMLVLPCLDGEQPPCEQRGTCVTLPFWSGLQNAIDSYMDSVSLEDLILQYEEASAEGEHYVL